MGTWFKPERKVAVGSDLLGETSVLRRSDLVRLPSDFLLASSARTAVPGGAVAGRLLASQRCWVGVIPRWPGTAALVMGCAGECRRPHDPKTGLICNYLLQCCGRLQFVPVQDVDYPVRTPTHVLRYGRTDELPQPGT